MKGLALGAPCHSRDGPGHADAKEDVDSVGAGDVADGGVGILVLDGSDLAGEGVWMKTSKTLVKLVSRYMLLGWLSPNMVTSTHERKSSKLNMNTLAALTVICSYVSHDSLTFSCFTSIKAKYKRPLLVLFVVFQMFHSCCYGPESSLLRNTGV